MGTYVLFPEKMLANLTSLIWGTPNAEEPKDAAAEDKPASGGDPSEAAPESSSSRAFKCATPTIRAATPVDEEESDWVLVDRAEAGGVSHGDDQTTTQRLPVPSSVLASSPLPFAGEVGETATQEWLMTPPPCFTRSQTAPLASSPLENLLIEHPSMSVYLPRPTSAAIGRIFPRRVLSHPSPYSRSSPSVSPSSVLTPDENDDSPMREEVSSETGGQQVAVPQPRNRVAQRAAKLLQAIDVLRPAQKAQRRREERRLKAKHLERSNKVREVASAGNKRSRRCDMMAPAKFSRAVNNRKC